MPKVERQDSEEHHSCCQGEDSESPLGGGLHGSGSHQVTGTALKGEPVGSQGHEVCTCTCVHWRLGRFFSSTY